MLQHPIRQAAASAFSASDPKSIITRRGSDVAKCGTIQQVKQGDEYVLNDEMSPTAASHIFLTFTTQIG